MKGKTKLNPAMSRNQFVETGRLFVFCSRIKYILVVN
jgi:hypothetical protein